jgi:8-oxo-dGTP pyrophosphatase MutT (NUDIX family)
LTDRLPIREYASAGGVIVDSSGEHILLLLRPGRLGPDGRPEARLPKGHIEPGESRLQAALREVHEEAGLSNLEIHADLGHQTVEFDRQGRHYIRDESYFLLKVSNPLLTQAGQPEKQFERQWLTWEKALARLTFAAEREWVQRAQTAYTRQMLYITERPRSAPPVDPQSLPGEAACSHR